MRAGRASLDTEIWPGLSKASDQCADRTNRLRVGTEIETGCDLGRDASARRRGEARTYPEVTRQGLENMLPRSGGGRVADGQCQSVGTGADDIRHNPICGKVAAADDIASAGRGDPHGVLGGEE